MLASAITTVYIHNHRRVSTEDHLNLNFKYKRLKLTPENKTKLPYLVACLSLPLRTYFLYFFSVRASKA